MGAFTNDVIILGEGFENMAQDDGGVGLKMVSLFYMMYGKNYNQFDF